MRTAGN